MPDITRSGASALIPQSTSREIVQEVVQQSAFLSMARRLADMSTNQHKIPVLSALPEASFVSEKGQKGVTAVEWENVFLEAEELAVIVPIAEQVLADADYDIWSEIKPLIVQEFHKKIDEAALFSTAAKPSSWPDPIGVQAVAAGNYVDLSTVVGGGGDVYDAIMGEGGLLSKVEEDGYAPNGHIASISMKAKYRGLRDANGQPIFVRSMQEGVEYELDVDPIRFVRNTRTMDDELLLQITGDWTRAVWSMRQDITFKLLTEAALQDAAGNIVYNLAQQDMVALRCVMRLGWALPNPPTLLNPDENTRFPFGALVA